MNLGQFFLIASIILFFLAGISLFAAGTVWGLLCLTLGILLSGVPIRLPSQPS